MSEERRAKVAADEMRKANLIDELSARLINETDGLFTLEDSLMVIKITKELPRENPLNALRWVILSKFYRTEEEWELMKNCLILVFGAERARTLCALPERPPVRPP